MSSAHNHYNYNTTGSNSHNYSRNNIISNVISWFKSLLDFLIGLLATFRPPEIITVNSKSFTILKSLGEGGFAFVYLVKATGMYEEPLALKRIKIQLPEQQDRLIKEIHAHEAVSSPHVLKLLDSMIVKDSSGQIIEGLLLLPYYPNGTVQDLIDKDTDIPIRQILKITKDVCRGLLAFHSHLPSLAFRDLKPANILLDVLGNAVLMDLGSVSNAKIVLRSRREAIVLQDLCAETCTAPFRPPELFDPPSHGEIDESSDIWSLGCTIYAMAFKEPPFDGTMTATVGGQVQFPTKVNNYPLQFRVLIENILQTNPQKRPKITEIISLCNDLEK